MKKPEEYYHTNPDFSEFLWMAEDGADEGLQQQVFQLILVHAMKHLTYCLGIRENV